MKTDHVDAEFEYLESNCHVAGTTQCIYIQQTDASVTMIVAVLYVCRDDKYHPVAMSSLER